MISISTHVLDTARGRPARGIAVRLERRASDGAWRQAGGGVTDDDGRVSDLLPPGEANDPGGYRLTFATGDYFAATGGETFYPEVTVEFTVSEAAHHHVPLLLSPFGYSTYRGS